ncbi:conserved hypothetical protein [Neospora caninum Liverpool]|uniref:Uncharacterized protein n=1 Tax=Neospora caninum (strain Liverpool) TaxID=572307 RepID=F0VQL6_NEOCL|nr:conserved hypothetical protein [Neospora caninum Liverpool]CBZ56013.1 conserved hypothetical protein [Neospora caninum Liverpool]CEL70759.1 TPA: hypothetical protein BN1204_064390 [Neospora caninum Liverpool]|eukprot:XP_003886039.1 conserved hypothetical protein [Neospora caninum Liverpool]
MSTEEHISQEMKMHTMSDIRAGVVAPVGNSDGVFIGEEQQSSFRPLTFLGSSTKSAGAEFLNDYTRNPNWLSSLNMAASISACASKTSSTRDSGVAVPAVTQPQLCFSDGFQLPAGPPEKLRRLDPTDLFWQAYHNIGNLMICNCITVLTTHPVVLEHLRAAAEMLLCRHQTLRCSINDRDSPEEQHPQGTHKEGATQDKSDPSQEDKSFAGRLRTLFTRGADSLCCSCRRRKRKVYVWKDNRSSARLDVAMARWECSDAESARERFGTMQDDEWVKAMAFEQNVGFDTCGGTKES